MHIILPYLATGTMFSRLILSELLISDFLILLSANPKLLISIKKSHYLTQVLVSRNTANIDYHWKASTMTVSNGKLYFIFCIAFTISSFTRISAQNDSVIIHQNTIAGTKDSPDSFKTVSYKPEFISSLPKTVKETSGLVFFDGQLWTMNDGGNPPEIFQIDTATGNILRKVVIGNTVNTDWESITQDDSNLYIGDFGNNYGNRKDLRILKIAKTDLDKPAKDTIQAGSIYFRYPDQVDFTPALNANNFDCEAFFFHNDSLHLFSKDWTDLQTRHYVIPADTGSYGARYIEQFHADGLITDASINELGNIVLLGYKNTGGRFWDCFCWLLTESNDSHYFKAKKTRIELGSAFHLGQSEGIVLNNDNKAWLSSESIRVICINHPAKLFRLDLSKYF